MGLGQTEGRTPRNHDVQLDAVDETRTATRTTTQVDVGRGGGVTLEGLELTLPAPPLL